MNDDVFERSHGYLLSLYGVAPGALRTEIDDDLRATLVTIASAPLSDEQIEAIRLVLHAVPHVTFTDASNAEKWRLLAKRLAKVQARARAQTMRGEAPDLPVYDPAKGDLAAFARAAERYCGYEPGSVAAVEGTTITLRPTEIGASFAKLAEVLRAGTVDADEVWVGVIGTARPDGTR